MVGVQNKMIYKRITTGQKYIWFSNIEAAAEINVSG